MKILFYILYSFSGTFWKTVTPAISYVLGIYLSTSVMAFTAPQEETVMRETVQVKENNKPAVSPSPVFLDEDLLPEMTMFLAVGKNGKVLFVSSYGEPPSQPKGISLGNSEIFMTAF